MQMKSKKRKWSVEERNLSLMLYYKSSSMYKYMRSLKIVLPATSTLRCWLGRSKLKPGLNKNILNQVTKKFNGKTKREKTCILSFDEMSIKTCLEYSKDLDMIEGFQDLGSLGRSELPAQKVLVFLLRGIYSSRKLPVSYYFSDTGVKTSELSILLKDVILKLNECGIFLKAVVCDQSTTNVSVMNSMKVTPENPFFEVNNKRIIAIYDAPHLLKSFRNNMLDGFLAVDKNLIDFEDIRITANIDKNNKKCKALLKITDMHLYPNSFQKMSVRYAAQIFSNSVYAAMKTCIKTKELQTVSAINTANFIKMMNDLFDTLNSRNQFSRNPLQCALSDSQPQIRETMENAYNFIEKMIKINKKNSKQSRPPCFRGMLQTIRAILKLYDEEKREFGTTYLLTNRLNQDPNENLFSVFRQRGGYNVNPTCRTIRTSFRSIFVNCLIKPPKTSNCEADNDTFLELDMEKDTEVSNEVENLYSTEDSLHESSSSEVEEDTQIECHILKNNLEDCAVVYFAGYLAKLCIDNFKCEDCKDELVTKSTLNDNTQLLLLYRNYKNINSSSDVCLTAPSDAFAKIINECLDQFETVWSKNYYKENLKQTILTVIYKKFDNWIKISSECEIHKKFIIVKLVQCKIIKNSKKFVLKKSTDKTKRKLQILQSK